MKRKKLGKLVLSYNNNNFFYYFIIIESYSHFLRTKTIKYPINQSYTRKLHKS